MPENGITPSMLSARRVAAIARHELRILRNDPAPLAVLLVLPLVLIALLRPAYAKAGVISRPYDANGADQVVTGMTVTFAFNLVSVVGFAFLRDHSWRTWDRLRASPVAGVELLLGKTVAPLVEAAVQFTLLFGLGALVFGLKVRGSPVALVCVGAAFSLCLVAIGLVLAAFCQTTGQVYATTNIVGLILAGIGGAIVPDALLPGWIHIAARFDPASWAMGGYQRIVLAGGGLLAVLPALAALTSLSAVLLIAASIRFRFDEAKLV